jgi:hypothetical protein
MYAPRCIDSSSDLTDMVNLPKLVHLDTSAHYLWKKNATSDCTLVTAKYNDPISHTIYYAQGGPSAKWDHRNEVWWYPSLKDVNTALAMAIPLWERER